MTMPGDISSQLVRDLRSSFSKRELIELTLDIMKWNAQKVPVALGADADVVEGELSDLVFDADGRWVR